MFTIDQYRYGMSGTQSPKYSPKSVPVQAPSYSPQTADLGGAPTLGQRYQQAGAEIAGFGNRQATAMEQSYKNAMGTAMTKLAPGLAGTTIAPSMRMGYWNQFQQQLGDFGQQIQALKTNTLTNIAAQANQQAYQYAGLNQQAQQQAQQLGYGYAGLNQQALAQQQQNALAWEPYSRRLTVGGSGPFGGSNQEMLRIKPF